MTFNPYEYWKEYRIKHPEKFRIAKKQVRINPVSKSLKKMKTVYGHLRKDFLDMNPDCQASLPGCTGDATEIHHKKGKIGNDLNDVSNFLSTCRHCHNWIELNPLEAKKLNLSKNRL